MSWKEMTDLAEFVFHVLRSVAMVIGSNFFAFYTGNRFLRWKNNLLGEPWQPRNCGIFKGIGCVRNLVNAPDGCLYIVLNQPDRVMRLVPGGQ